MNPNEDTEDVADVETNKSEVSDSENLRSESVAGTIPPTPASYSSSGDISGILPQSERPPRLYLKILIGALISGVAFSVIFGDAVGIGFNVFVQMLVFYAAWYFIAAKRRIPGWRKICAGVALVYGAAIGVRASYLLVSVNIVLVLGFTGMACSAGYSRQIKTVWGHIVDFLQLLFNLLFGCILYAVETPWRTLMPERKSVGTAGRIIAGAFMAVPFLLVFGLLFSSAELSFGQIFITTFQNFIDAFFSHFWLVFWGVFFSLGLLRGAFLSGPVTEGRVGKIIPVKVIGLVESVTVLSLLNAMFFVFVITQIPYLFGGQARVSDTPGLPWSEYARRGFFELATVAALLIPTLMFFIKCTDTPEPRQRKLLNGLCVGLSALTGVIIASALQRMLLYTHNFGLTELRVYVSVFIVMLAIVLVALNVFTIMERNQMFVPAVLAIGVVFSIGIQIPNVQGWVARDIIKQSQQDKNGDMKYLSYMSTDAVPAIADSNLESDVKRRIILEVLPGKGSVPMGFDLLNYSLSNLTALHILSSVGR